MTLKGETFAGFHIQRQSQRSKLTFSKSRLLATFSCKMVAIKKILVSKKKRKKKLKSRGRHFVNVAWMSTAPRDTFSELLRLLTYQLKDCNNGQDKEKEENPMSGSRNCLLQSSWDWVTNCQWHAKPFKSIKLAIVSCRNDQVNNWGRFTLIWTGLDSINRFPYVPLLSNHSAVKRKQNNF